MIITDILQQLKDFYGIIDTTKDVELTLSIKKSLAKLECELGCNICKTDQSGADLIHEVEFDNCLLCYSCPQVQTCIPNITEILTYDGVTVTDQSDYQIIGKNKDTIQLKEICSCSCTKCKKIKITFKGGLTQLDSCLLNYFTSEYDSACLTEGGREIKKIVMGDVSREYFEGGSNPINDVKAKYGQKINLFYCPGH